MRRYTDSDMLPFFNRLHDRVGLEKYDAGETTDYQTDVGEELQMMNGTTPILRYSDLALDDYYTRKCDDHGGVFIDC